MFALGPVLRDDLEPAEQTLPKPEILGPELDRRGAGEQASWQLGVGRHGPAHDLDHRKGGRIGRAWSGHCPSDMTAIRAQRSSFGRPFGRGRQSFRVFLSSHG